MVFDPLYFILIGPTLLLALWAQYKVKSAFNHWSQEANASGMSGAEAAADMLIREGVNDVRIEEVEGWLSDHYDPREKVLRLSPDVYSGRSVAALGIACHEAGHALQHANGYAFLGLRSLLVPTASIGGWMAVPLFFVGLMLSSMMMMKIGVVLFGAVVVFQLITLPVEFNASSRAKLALQMNGVVRNHEEIEGVNQVLDAAALTYVAAALQSLAQLVYFILRMNSSRDE